MKTRNPESPSFYNPDTLIGRVKTRLPNLDELKKEIVRELRRGLRIGLVASILLTSGFGDVEKKNTTGQPGQAIHTLVWSPNQEGPRLNIGQEEIVREEAVGVFQIGNGLVFQINNDGLPVSYKTQDGELWKLDKTSMVKAREKAIASQELEVVDIIYLPEKIPAENKGTLEHPVLDELPADFLSSKELEERGITIIQSNSTEMFLRRSAFEEGGLFEHYGDGKLSLTIALLDGPFVSDVFMTGLKYRAIMEALLKAGMPVTNVDTEPFRQQQIKNYEKQLTVIRQSEIKNDFLIGAIKADIWKIKHAYQAQLWEMIARVPFEGESAFEVGRATAPITINGEIGALITLPIGKSKISYDSSVVIYCDPKGKFYFSYSPSHAFIDSEPKYSQSFPNPNQLVRKSHKNDPKNYLYKYFLPGGVVAHEAGHIEGFAKGQGIGNTYLLKDFPPELIKYEETHPGRTELSADIYMELYLHRAWEKWENSGFTDNSGYQVAFRLKEGGFILTNTKSPQFSRG